MVINNLLEAVEKYPLSNELLTTCIRFFQYSYIPVNQELLAILLEKKKN